MSQAVDALNSALAGEHAAIYGIGVLGARLAGARAARAESYRNAHRSARDALIIRIATLGGQALAAEPAYQVAVGGGVTAALDQLAGIEERLADRYAELVLQTDPEIRKLAVGALRDCALRAAAWRGRAEIFPGLTEPRPTSAPTP